MDNALKALLMAGGVLLALLVLGALILMFNQLSTYQKSTSDIEKNSQLVAFNTDFERYTDDEIKGVDIISIINKVVDYNNKAVNGGTVNSINYDIKMSVTVENIRAFKNKYAITSNDIFKADTIKVTNTSNNFAEIIRTYSEYENQYTLSVMSKLASNYEKIDKSGYIEGTNNYKKLIQEIVGKNINVFPEKVKIKNYKNYSEFKSSTFKSNKSSNYQNGQIKDLYFEFVR